jgi:hypothetical protein
MEHNLLFLSSNLSSVVTAASLNNKSIHNAASETAKSSPAASLAKAGSLDPRIRSGLNENSLVLPEMKSDRTQKKVTVFKG